MRLAFAIVSLFPWGGLQRDCMRLARAAELAGHDVTIFASRRSGELPGDLEIEVLPVRSLTNHGRNRRFSEALRTAVTGHFDRVVGFDKLPGLDVLYCGDLCFADSHRTIWAKLNPRFREMLALEEACFAPGSRTKVLALAEPQIAGYRRAWQTPDERIILLPPQIDAARRRPEFRSDGTRERMRAELGLAGETTAILSVGAWPHRKGFDRVIATLPAIPQARYIVCGVAPESREGATLLRQASSLQVADRVRLLGAREDVPELMAAADLFVHPARAETTGTVILEAIINALPIVVTEVCGFSSLVQSSGAGIVIPEPFTILELTGALRHATEASRRAIWSAKAAQFGSNLELRRSVDRALQVILEAG